MFTTDAKPLLFINDKLVPYADAGIHMLSPCVKYGAAVFEGIRGYWNENERQIHLFRLNEHLARLANSMRTLEFDEGCDPDRLTRNIVELIRANNFNESLHVRLTAYLDGSGEQDALGPVGFAIAALPAPPMARTSIGVSAGVSSWRRIADDSLPARVKASGNYLNSRLASREARKNQYDTAILLNSRGKVSEGPGMCLFIVRAGRVITPAVTSDILESITRDTVIRLGHEHLGVSVIERDVDRTELYTCEEAFFCGTGWEICPITSVDRLAVGTGAPGPFVKKLQELYLGIATGRNAAYAAWRTPVYDSDQAHGK